MTKKITLKDLEKLIMEQAKIKGFGTKPEEINVAEKIALIHTEVAEAYEAFRHKDMDSRDGFRQEMGDIVARVLHLAGIMGVDIEAEILKKLDSNKAREWKWDKMNETNSKKSGSNTL